MDVRLVIVEDGGSTSIDLGEQHERVVLGRGRGASLDDRTVSQMHVSLELQRQQQQAADREVPWVVKMRVLGYNPVCVLRSSSSRSPRDVEFVGRGEEAALRAGDRLSLSIVKPVFYRVKEFPNVEEGSRNGAGNGDELLSAWKSRKKPEVLEAESKAVIKDQKSLVIDPVPKSVEVSGVGLLSNAADDLGSRPGEIDPVTDLGFLVEGSEFDKYDRQRKPDLRKWSWKSSTGTEEGEDGGLENAASTRKRKEDDTEWHGEDEEEKQVLSNVRVPEQRKETRSRALIQSDVSKSIQPVGKKKKRRKKDEESTDEEEEDDDPTLGGFIVDDIEEEEAEQDGMEEEDEFSNDDSEEEAETPWCKYGSSCFRKNPDHLLNFRHPE